MVSKKIKITQSQRHLRSLNEEHFGERGFIKLDGIEELLGKKFITQFRQTIHNDINFLTNDINFAIVKEGGPYDLEPFLKFKY